MSNYEIYDDIVAFHPGSYIEEIIDDLNITQEEFAERLGVSPKTISKLINAEVPVSTETANKLSKLTGISMSTWLQMQNSYDIKKTQIEEKRKSDEYEICSKIDFSYFKLHKFIPNKQYKAHEKIEELRKLLQIADLTFLKNYNSNVSYRNTRGFSDISIINSNVVLELAINFAKHKANKKLDKTKLKNLLPELRKMTTQKGEEFFPILQEMLIECGVILVALPSLRNASLNGATKKFKNGSVLLLITDKNKKSDIFWFSIFHEIGHIINGDFYSDYEDDETYQAMEKKADLFAQDILIPNEDYKKFIETNNFTKSHIISFGEEIGIDPSIVLGRLQKEKYVNYSQFSDLKTSYKFVTD
ncbi:HigA family addiction module antitoxin [Streptococcus dysgalactiae]|uniref:Helix-turn-helix domain-containing protein n=1 Tax=Streptococcus dysgalactiae TaxID=1334 RepID=A0A9X9QNZ9_STRDY|nr:HigA family addiction module antitoxin [Streptococcus dysgalactiae]VTS48589.1 helix-turn-helix domain-containing protein [Streptococcus dysgalactiae subsp. equisimilis]VTS50289.1 helix-turn-helix domain-containing protein [Streptococcus dysgalactiae subsp. equisimilis]VTS78003.1 helix-turn-helix domain-containing protein [Streptococcus dysgalactiae]